MINRMIKAVGDPRSLPAKIARRLKLLTPSELRWRVFGYDYVTVIGKTRMKVLASSTLGRMIRNGGFEEDEQSFVGRLLRDGDCVVDVGANDGLFTLLSASCVGRTGRVLSFEPCEDTFQRLVENVHHNGFSNVQCVKIALSDDVGDVDFYVSTSGADAWNSLVGDLTGGSCIKQRVPMTTFDRYVTDKAPRFPDFMKIDVEGWEIPVLTGANQCLSRTDAPLLQVEFTKANASAGGRSTDELYKAIACLGYRQFTFDGVRNALIELSAAPEVEYCNVYALKAAEHFDRVRKAGFRVVLANIANDSIAE